jgi:glycosyl transferase, family 25
MIKKLFVLAILTISIFYINKYFIDIDTRIIKSTIKIDLDQPSKLEKVYLINLDRDKEKFARSKEQLDRLNITFERFDAVDGYDAEITDPDGKIYKGIDIKNGILDLSKEQDKIFTVKCREVSFKYHPKKYAKKRMLSAGEIGCICSHLEVVNLAKKQNLENVLILEDDSLYHDLISQEINKFFAIPPKNWDISYIFAINDKKLINISNNDVLYKLASKGKKYTHSTASYILSNKGMDIILANAQFINRPIDNFYSDLIKDATVEAYKFRKDLILTEIIESSITKMKK